MPMICPKCGFEQAAGQGECLRCGVVFAKLAGRVRASVGAPEVREVVAAEPKLTLKELLLPIPEAVNAISLAGRTILWILLCVWGSRFIFNSVSANYAGESIMHLVNLPFHEAGHVIFSPLGHFIQALGGTLGQLMMPAVCLYVLLMHTRDAFGAAVAQWWLAESFMDVAPYIDDARSLELVLLGGVTGKDVEDYHDWEFLLRKAGLLRMDHFLAQTAQWIGILLMLGALAWSALWLWCSWQKLRDQAPGLGGKISRQ